MKTSMINSRAQLLASGQPSSQKVNLHDSFFGFFPSRIPVDQSDPPLN